MREIQIFENAEFGKVRTIVIDNEPWFVGKDIATALGYAKPENAIANHVDEEDKTSTLIQGSGSNYKSKTIVINESGVCKTLPKGCNPGKGCFNCPYPDCINPNGSQLSEEEKAMLECGSPISKAQEYQRAYRQQHRQEIREYDRAYRQQHRQEIREYNRAYYQQHHQETREYNRAYYQQHRQEIRERNRAYRQQHRQEIRERNRAYYQQHRQETRERNRAYYQQHRQEVLEYQQEYRQRHRQELLEYQRAYYREHRQETLGARRKRRQEILDE